jgi:hypothetical protein
MEKNAETVAIVSRAVPCDQSPSVGKLAEALARAQAEFKPVIAEEEANVGQYKYSYATLATHYDATRPALTKHGLAVIQTMRVEARGNVLVATLVHASGEFIRSEIGLPSADSPQKFGGIVTYYRRYQYSALVGTATEDDDAQEAEQSARSQSPSQPNNYSPRQDRTVSEKQLGRLYAIARSGGWTRDQVIEKMRDLFGKSVFEELNWAEYDKICNHLLENKKGGDEHSQVPPEERAAAAVDKQTSPVQIDPEKLKALTPVQANQIRNLAKELSWPPQDLATYLSGLAGKPLKTVNELPSTKFEEACTFIKAHPYPAPEAK